MVVVLGTVSVVDIAAPASLSALSSALQHADIWIRMLRPILCKSHKTSVQAFHADCAKSPFS